MRRLGGIMNRTIAAVSYRIHIAAANMWRDAYNPLRGLTIRRAISLLEAGERGEMADLQWTYRFIEMQDPVLGALIERRITAIQKLDWSIKVRDKIPAGKEAIAKRQEDALRATYENISNLTDCFEDLVMASFRGYVHLEKVRDAQGRLSELAVVDQWFWVRPGLYGEWELNRDARFGSTRGEPVDLSRFVIREVKRPINRVALPIFTRKGLAGKDWDAFIESFGVPAVFIIMPPDVPEGQEEEYQDLASQVMSDAQGALPHGSDVKTVDGGARGANPFKEHLDFQDAQLVLRGTGGKLTMLSEPTGLGEGATGAHEAAFDALAQAEAKVISQLLQRQIDAEVIQAVTPGERAYAYFELSANEETNVSEIAKDVTEFESAGLEVDLDWVKEKTGYPLSRKAAPEPATPPAALPTPKADPVMNRLVHVDGVWKRFKRETGTLGIPREVMPQIDSRNRGAVVNFFRARGIECSRETVKPADLKPSQAEYAPEKVANAKAVKSERPLLISGDNHVIDGHHQYLGDLQDAPNVPVEVFRIKAPAMQVIGMLLAMPSTSTAPMPVRNRAERSEALAEALGVTTGILAPVADLIETLAGSSEGDRTDDAAWLDALEEASLRLPELFDARHGVELAASLESALGGAALRGARDGIKEDQTFADTDQ